MTAVHRIPKIALVPILALLSACQPTGDAATDATPGASAVTTVDPAARATDAPAAAGGTELEEATRALVEGSVRIAASLVACDMGDKEQADKGIADQRESQIARGASGAAYDRVVATAWKDTTARFDAASATEKAQACASMAAFGGQLQQMADDVEGMKPNGG